MERLRRSDNLEVAKDCGVAMRLNEPEAQALRARFDSLPVPRPWGLSMAMTEIGRCVTCLENAGAACVRADSSLNLPEP
jgi:hypothetical protein